MSPLTQLFYEISYGGCRWLTHADEVIEYASRPLMAQSRHRLLRGTCLPVTQSGHKLSFWFCFIAWPTLCGSHPINGQLSVILRRVVLIMSNISFSIFIDSRLKHTTASVMAGSITRSLLRRERNQRQLITELEADGNDTREALALLARFEDLRAVHLSDRDRLIDEIRSAEI